jgi:glucosamine 6-phosphate synthetase-like amidotransferase/phosphosugar isomerase protein
MSPHLESAPCPLSQSGETADTLEILKAAQREKKDFQAALAFCNILKGLLVHTNSGLRLTYAYM